MPALFQDFFYVCPSHLKDKGFCAPIVDEAAVAARKKKELDVEVERVKQEFEEKQKKKREKEKEKEKDKDKSKDEKKSEENDKKKLDDKVTSIRAELRTLVDISRRNPRTMRTLLWRKNQESLLCKRPSFNNESIKEEMLR